MEKSKSKISEDQAKLELEKWLDIKKINQRKRDDKEEFAKEIIDSIMSGEATIDEKGVITYNLLFPIKTKDDKVTISSFAFKPRLMQREAKAALQGIKADDGDGRIVAYISALTGQARAIIGGLDTIDHSFCQAVALYFL